MGMSFRMLVLILPDIQIILSSHFSPLFDDFLWGECDFFCFPRNYLTVYRKSVYVELNGVLLEVETVEIIFVACDSVLISEKCTKANIFSILLCTFDIHIE